jgi:CRP/FNR family transcriptional regulator, cyclic AMP receptor protein
MFDYPDQTASLARRALLSDLHDDEVATIVSYAQHRRFADGEVAVRHGERDRSVFLVVSGTFEVRGGGRRHGVLEAGAIFGELSFFDAAPRSADVVAVGVAEALMMTLATFDRLRLNEPRLAVLLLMDLGRVVTSRLRDEMRRSDRHGPDLT